MADDRSGPAPLRVLGFNPSIRGIRNNYKVRSMLWNGQVWLCAKDAGEAAGWHPDTIRHRRQEALSDDAWGYATIPTMKGEHMMVLVSRDALSELLTGSKSRQARAFKRWLDSDPVCLSDTATQVAATSAPSS